MVVAVLAELYKGDSYFQIIDVKMIQNYAYQKTQNNVSVHDWTHQILTVIT